MKIYYDKRAKDPIYYIQHGFRNGKKTTTKNIARVGRHSELLLITDDPLGYAKEKCEEMNRNLKNEKVTMEVSLDFSKKLDPSDTIVSSSTQKNIGYFFLQKIYHELQIDSFFKEKTADSRITFDPNLINRFMTIPRILYPASKLATHADLSRYYESPDFEYIHMMRTMDILEENYDDYISHLFDKSNKVVKRDTSVCYFDCSNYYFETESEDEDYVDVVTGEIIKGLRRYGVSKEHRPNPIVEMGLFMDSKGIPLSMCIHSGSDNEQTIAVPAEKKLAKILGDSKDFIYCADAGLGSSNIRYFNSLGGRSFIVTQSIKKLSESMKNIIFGDSDYKLLSDDSESSLEMMKSFDRTDPENRKLYNDRIYKVIPADFDYDLGYKIEKKYKNGKIHEVKAKSEVKQVIIVTFSRKMMEYQRAVRNRQIERAKKILVNIDPETYKKGPHDVTRFIKRVKKKKDGQDEPDQYYLDSDTIAREEIYDGFYAVATNLTEDPAKKILEISSKRYQIEDCFRITKTNFSARPVYHNKDSRIKAHFMICYTALLIYRLLEAKLEEKGYHFTISNILDTLRSMEVDKVEDLYYHSTYTNSKVLEALNDTFGLGLDMKYYKTNALDIKLKKFST